MRASDGGFWEMACIPICPMISIQDEGWLTWNQHGTLFSGVLDTGSPLGLILPDSFDVGQLPFFLSSSVSQPEEKNGKCGLT